MLGAALGLDPSSRSRLGVASEKEDDAFDVYLKSRTPRQSADGTN